MGKAARPGLTCWRPVVDQVERGPGGVTSVRTKRCGAPARMYPAGPLCAGHSPPVVLDTARGARRG